ncbi:helix-turn-helix domain-containing protein [Nocardia sp. NBC_00565]|uniref:BTAD domain-containing putative transcriptional regulator n=1 Tax=Nocardia sp. NBC_00565 TaxID=2975993 RepID=UPI002E822ECE|nr:BTAD domain-containing putative transcriptional regulator [Nocardia sp. NBC_00565]WUC06237.1 helix-turn-helix domain-containing protein [Nocardia sp. NBC_00565]
MVDDEISGPRGRLAAMVRKYRRRAGLTQQETAESAGLSVGALRDLEQGRVARPRGSTLRMLGDVLELSHGELAELLREVDEGSAVGLRIEVLGPLRVWVHGKLVDPGSETQRLLLGMLALSPNHPVPRNTLLEMICGECPRGQTGHLLQSRISRLRGRLQPNRAESESDDILAAVHGGYRLSVADGQHDLKIYYRTVIRARAARDHGDLSAACELFAEAVRLWRGEPLAGLDALQSHPTVVRLAHEYRTVVVEYAAVAAELGRYHAALPLLRRAADTDSLNEAVHRELMIALAGGGQQAAALAVFDTLRHRLADELGADPGPDLTAAYYRILRQEVAAPEVVPITAHRQLPPATTDFTGRAAQLRELWDALPAPGKSNSMTICAILGMGGVGKTKLAVQMAHRLLADGRYRDIQLHADLRGYASRPPAEPAVVLGSFLRLLGVPSDRIPASLDDRSALYRDRLYDKHALVLLDNVAGESQLLPLLPAGPDNLVLVTSRRTLWLDGAHTLSLSAFTADEARRVLIRAVGEARVAAEPDAVDQVLTRYGRLPLAVALVARRLQSRSTWRFADFLERLDEVGGPLNEQARGSRHLRAVFDLSYQALDPVHQRLFRLLGLHPRDDFTVYSVAALAALTSAQTRQQLDRLVDEHMIVEVDRHHYRLPGLLADYARDRAASAESRQERRSALTRLLTSSCTAVPSLAEYGGPSPRRDVISHG